MHSRTPDPLAIDRSLVLVVDIQQRLASAMPADAMEETTRQASNLVFGARQLGVPVAFTEQYPKGLGATLEVLRAESDERVFEKTVFDASAVPDLSKYIEKSGRDQVILLGMEAHICVRQSARGLHAQGLHVTVASDATCSRNPDHRRLAEGLWRSHAEVSCVETVLFDWLGQAGGDAFKAISRRIR